MKTIVITGCNSGIGNAAINYFGKDFYTIGIDLLDNNVTNANEFYKIDCSNEIQIIKTLSHITKIDILINCAGISGKRADITDLANNDYLECFNNNFLSTLNLLKIVIPTMRNNKSGKIVNIASILGGKGLKQSSAYAASKAAIVSLTKSAAAENAEYGIHINSISPATINTPMITTLNPTEKDYSQIYPTGNCGTALDVIYVIDMLIKNNFMTGNDITLDGGISQIVKI